MAEHTINYTTTKGHLMYFSFAHTLRQNAVRVMFAIPIIYFAWVVLQGVNRRQLPFPLKLTIVVAAILAVILFILSVHLIMTLLIYMGRGKDPGVLTTHTVTLDENGISEVTAAGHSDQNWKSVVDLRRTRKFIMIYTQRHAAHLIPISAFASPEAADEFYNFAVHQWKEATRIPV